MEEEEFRPRLAWHRGEWKEDTVSWPLSGLGRRWTTYGSGGWFLQDLTNKSIRYQVKFEFQIIDN